MKKHVFMVVRGVIPIQITEIHDVNSSRKLYVQNGPG